MNDKHTDSSRLDELEARAAFQDDLIDSLNQVVARQDRELADVARRVRDLETRLAELAEATSLPGSGGGHEVPPHY